MICLYGFIADAVAVGDMIETDISQCKKQDKVL